jgi:hypothetical protein
MAERRACTACMRDMGVRGSACVQEHIKRRAGRIVQRIELRALRIVETQRLRDLLDGPGGDRAAWLVNGPLLWCRHGRIGAYRRIAKNALVEIRIGVRPEVVVGIGIQGVIENVPGSIGPEQRAAPQSAARTEMRVSSCKKMPKLRRKSRVQVRVPCADRACKGARITPPHVDISCGPSRPSEIPFCGYAENARRH